MSHTLPARAEAPADQAEPLLEVRDLRVGFPDRDGEWLAVKGVSFELRRGTALSLVGESGSGKSVTARAIMGLLGRTHARVSGTIRFLGRDLAGADPRTLRRIRGRQMALVFQDPMRSLNPTMRIGTQVSEPLRLHLGLSRHEARARAIGLLESVRIPAAAQRVDEYPHQLSGGMRQRVMIAMALACSPRLLIADEPTTALDVTTQAQIMDLLRDLQQEYAMAMILISHDIGLAAEYTDQTAVMYAGQFVEQASSETVLRHPRMPYTAALLDSVPRLDQEPHSRLAAIEGTPPGPGSSIEGCPFEGRCTSRQDRCAHEAPPFEEGEPGHAWACWYPR